MRTSSRTGLARSLAGGAVLMAAVLAGSITLGSAPPASSSVVPPPAPGPPPDVPGPDHAYLGAFADPSGSGIGVSAPLRRMLQPEMDAVDRLNPSLARPLSIVSAYQDWTEPLYDSQIDQILAAGAIPMITWSCGDTDTNVSGGRDDSAVIIPFAEKLAALGAPVLLRWFPDPNLTATAATARCLGGAGAAGYVGAFSHIKQVFQSVGATNVAFVWSVDTTAGDATWTSWFPGAANVDWVGADDSGQPNPAPSTAGFATRFQSWYDAFSPLGKPLIITGTGTAAADQAAYLTDIAHTVPARFPQIRALVYLDAPESGPSGAPAPGASAVTAGPDAAGLAALSREPFFRPPRATTSVVVSVPASTVAVGQVVKMTATVTGSQPMGSISFLVDGRTIPGCEAVPVRSGRSCSVSSLPAGTDAVTAVYSGDAIRSGASSAPVNLTVSPTALWSGTPAIPSAGHAYLGAWVQPTAEQTTASAGSRLQQELLTLPAFNASLGRPLSIVHVFQSWQDPAPNSALLRVLATGAIPMVDWKCGDSDANVAAGADDALITRFADQLAALRSPVLLRWYWEPNFNSSVSASASRCLDPPGQTLGPAGYVAAFRHIHDLFAAAGATNVGFVWSVGSGGTDQDMADYYPGSQYVDWIAVDGYDRAGGAGPGTVAGMFGRWYSWFSSFGLPMMISETGAVAPAQASYLSQVREEMRSAFPQIKAITYLDAASPHGTHNYVLTADGGLPGFIAMSRNSYFQPARPATVTSLEVAPNPASAHSVVSLRVARPAPDGGGAVTFTADGQVIPGCQDVPLTPAPLCRAADLGPGSHVLAAEFSGDAQFGPSQSETVVATVEAEAPPPAPVAPGKSPPAPQPPTPTTAVTPVDLTPAPMPVFSGEPTIAAVSPLPTTAQDAQPAGGAPLEPAGGWIRPGPPGSAPTGPGPELPPSADSTGATSGLDPVGAYTETRTGTRPEAAAAPVPASGSSLLVYLLVPVICAETYLFAGWLREEQLHRRRRMPLLKEIKGT